MCCYERPQMPVGSQLIMTGWDWGQNCAFRPRKQAKRQAYALHLPQIWSCVQLGLVVAGCSIPYIIITLSGHLDNDII